MSEYNMTHTGQELDDAIAKVLAGYELPTLYTGEYNITSNQTLKTAGKKLTSDLTVDVPVPDGYIKPTGILSNSLITRSSSSSTHKATIPSGYYVEENITISEWKSNQITGSGIAGGTFNIPYSSIGFIPTWAMLIANNASIKTANSIMMYISTPSVSAAWYFGSSTSTFNFKGNGTGLPIATFDSSGVTFPAISSSSKYAANKYRWYALR